MLEIFEIYYQSNSIDVSAPHIDVLTSNIGSFKTKQSNANQLNMTASNAEFNWSNIKMRNLIVKKRLIEINLKTYIFARFNLLRAEDLWSRSMHCNHWWFWKFQCWNLKIYFHRFLNHDSQNLLFTKFLNQSIMQNKRKTPRMHDDDVEFWLSRNLNDETNQTREKTIQKTLINRSTTVKKNEKKNNKSKKFNHRIRFNVFEFGPTIRKFNFYRININFWNRFKTSCKIAHRAINQWRIVDLWFDQTVVKIKYMKSELQIFVQSNNWTSLTQKTLIDLFWSKSPRRQK